MTRAARTGLTVALLICLIGAFASGLSRPVGSAGAQVLKPPGTVQEDPSVRPTQVLMSAQTIERINRLARRGSSWHLDLFETDPAAGRLALGARSVWPEAAQRMPDGSPVPRTLRASILSNARGAVRRHAYGIVIERGSLRALPSDERIVHASQNPTFDRLQLSALYALEPVRVFAESADGQYLLVRADHYEGWIKREHIERVEQDALRAYMDQERVLTVLADGLCAPWVGWRDGERIELNMGSRLPLIAPEASRALARDMRPGMYHGWMPTSEGEAAIALAGEQTDLVFGTPDLTQKAVSEQADRLLGEPYAWGGADRGRDCSAFVRDVYRCFGLWLPRDSAQQASFATELGLSQGVRFGALSDRDKLARIEAMPVGTLLFMPGHVMMIYESGGGPVRVIHDQTAHYERRGDELQRVESMQVTVSDLTMLDSRGNTYLSLIEGAFVPGEE